MSKEDDKLNKLIYKDIGSMCRKSLFLNEQPMRSAYKLKEFVKEIYAAKNVMEEEMYYYN